MQNQTFTIAAAQTSSVTGDVKANIAAHVRIAERAAKLEVDALVFPELSLTGYEPSLAAELAMNKETPELQQLQSIANEGDVTIIAGCPISSHESRPFIGAVIVSPGKDIEIYRKRFVHADEDPFFVSGEHTVIATTKGTRVGVAICADIHNDRHAADVFAAGADVYAAGVAITPSGIERALTTMTNHAKNHSLLTVMANYSERTGEFDIGGRSSLWGPNGDILATAPENGECLVVATKEHGRWQGYVVDLKVNESKN